MVAKISVSIDDGYKARIDEPLAYGDYRSHRVNDFLGIGLAVEDVLLKTGYIHAFVTDETDIWVGGGLDHDELNAFVREAVRREAERRSDGSPLRDPGGDGDE